MLPDPSPSPSGSTKRSSWFFGLRLICLPIFLLSASFFLTVTVRPLLLIRDAQSWEETPCTVDSSEVVYHADRDSNKGTYSVDIAYHYIFAGHPYASRRYSFVEGAWGRRGTQDAAVKAFPAGQDALCFVNPRAPQEAVLHRGWHPEMGLGSFGLTFALVTAIILVFPGQVTGIKPVASAVPTATAKTVRAGPTPSRYTPFGSCLRMLIGALVWNGMIGSIAYYLFIVADHEDVETGPKVIIWAFLIVGFLFLIQAVTDFFGLLKPRAHPTPDDAATP